MRRGIRYFLFIIILSTFLTCNREENEWGKAVEENTIQSYKQFIESFPDSKLKDDANARIIQLEFKTLNKESIEELEIFISKFSESPYSDSAKALINKYFMRKINSSPKDTIEELENEMLTYMEKYGATGRFYIPEMLPDENAQTGSVGVVDMFGRLMLTTFFEKDKVSHQYGGIISGSANMNSGLPTGDKSIWRMIGEHKHGKYTFLGSRGAPLTFMFIKDYGFVYLHGRGAVARSDTLIFQVGNADNW